MKRGFLGLGFGLLVALLVFSQSVFFVGERERAIVLQLGEAVETQAREPGVNFKLPFIQNAVFFENRILVFEIAKTESLTADLKAFEIDNYVCWRITDPLTFYRSLRTDVVAEERLRNIVYSQLRAAIGSKELNEVVFTKRTDIMDEVLKKSDAQAADYGVTIVDVRIKRTDLPNRQAIFNRMNAERTRMANKYRYEGESEDRRIRSEAEMQRDVILAQANRDSIVIRGKADARAIDIFARALSTDQEFYEFAKSLEIYRKSFRENTRVILSDDNPLLKFMR
ncbi:MAG: protease modulator HflC [Desulfovibrio sp.]|jgi:membrane protease subunit HflC|nr:protease modulator HflC [Desulfovibrio sp.]